jgi:hypothetical protein
MAKLLELSHELLHCIFVDVEPCDIAALSSTCRPFHDYIRDNRLLHRELYLRRYDEFEHDKRTNWEQQLHDRYQMERLLQTTDAATKRENLDFVATQMSKLMESAHRDFEQSKNLQMLSTAFKERQDNLNVFLCSSSLFHNKRAGDGTNHIPADNASTRQASAKLHCLYGVPIDTAPRRPIHSLMQPDLTIGPSGSTRSQVLGRQPVTHPWARSRVYDLREYTPSTLWGPFKADGSHQVDWEKVEAIMIALGHNIRRYQGREDSPVHGLWTEPFRGASPGSFHDPTPPATSPSAPTPHHEEALDAEDAEVFKIRELALKLDAMDPYGVTGTWMRVVCFLDYNDLYTYNFNVHGLPADDESRGPVSTDEGLIHLSETVRFLKPNPSQTDSWLSLPRDWCFSNPTDPHQAPSRPRRAARFGPERRRRVGPR